MFSLPAQAVPAVIPVVVSLPWAGTRVMLAKSWMAEEGEWSLLSFGACTFPKCFSWAVYYSQA